MEDYCYVYGKVEKMNVSQRIELIKPLIGFFNINQLARFIEGEIENQSREIKVKRGQSKYKIMCEIRKEGEILADSVRKAGDLENARETFRKIVLQNPTIESTRSIYRDAFWIFEEKKNLEEFTDFALKIRDGLEERGFSPVKLEIEKPRGEDNLKTKVAEKEGVSVFVVGFSVRFEGGEKNLLDLF